MTLLEGGRGHAVIQQRMEFQEVMRERFTEVIEQATGRMVIGFMSGNQQHPDLMCEVFHSASGCSVIVLASLLWQLGVLQRRSEGVK